MFKLERRLEEPSEGLRHLKEPKDIKGKHDHGISPHLTFYFNTEEERNEVLTFFKKKSRIPSGDELLRLLRILGKETSEIGDK